MICGCKSNIASILAEMGVSMMLAGNMGDGAVNVLNHSGIDVVRGYQGNVKDVALSPYNIHYLYILFYATKFAEYEYSLFFTFNKLNNLFNTQYSNITLLSASY